MPGRESLKVTLTCPDCGLRGTAVLHDTGLAVHAPTRRFSEISSGFHNEDGRTASGEALIICNGCDTILDV